MLLVGCADKAPYELDKNVVDQGFSYAEIQTESFRLSAAKRNSRHDFPLTIYLEGDGKAYITKTLPSNDPTPSSPLAWYLVQQDRSLNVAYLARPCQYTKAKDAACTDRRWWTNDRFHPEVTAALSRALDELKHSPAQKLHLVGYSGGATHAALLAAKREDVMSLRTVAGNLSPNWINRHHGVSYMPNAGDPLKVVERMKHIPQLHFVGMKDKVIPPALAQEFVAQQQSACTQVIEIDAGHAEGWQEQWAQLSQQEASCQ